MSDTPSVIPTVTPVELPADVEFDNVAQNTGRELNKLKKELGVDDAKTEQEHAEFLKIKEFFENNKDAIKKITHQELAQLKAAVMDENKDLEGTLTVTNDGAIDFKENTTSNTESGTETSTEPNTEVDNPQAALAVIDKAANKKQTTEGSFGENIAKGVGGFMGRLAEFASIITKLFANIGKWFTVFREGLGSLEELDAWKTFQSSTGDKVKNISTISKEQKQEIASLIAGLVPEGKKISSAALKPVLAGLDTGEKTEDELGQTIINHIKANSHLYGHEEPKPTEGDTKKQEQEKRQKQGKDFIENVGKIMVDGKNITDIKMPENDIKGTDGNTKKYKKYGSETEFVSYTAQEFGKYTLWQLYNMKDVYDVKNTTEPKVQLINTVITYFDGLTKEQKDAEQHIPLNELLKKIPELTKPTDTPPVAATETPSQPKGPEKTDKLVMRDVNNLVYANNKLWQWDDKNEFLEIYKDESSGKLMHVSDWAPNASTLNINEKGLKIKVIPFGEAQTMVDTAISEPNNPAKVENQYLWLPEGSFPADKLRDPK